MQWGSPVDIINHASDTHHRDYTHIIYADDCNLNCCMYIIIIYSLMINYHNGYQSQHIRETVSVQIDHESRPVRGSVGNAN